jgi:hypothetical protein
MRYEFTFAERVPEAVAAEFPELTRSALDTCPTTLYGRVKDTAQLHGLLARFRLLGLDMTDMHRLPD